MGRQRGHSPTAMYVVMEDVRMSCDAPGLPMPLFITQHARQNSASLDILLSTINLIGPSCVWLVQACAFPLFHHQLPAKMAAKWHQCIRYIVMQVIFILDTTVCLKKTIHFLKWQGEKFRCMDSLWTQLSYDNKKSENNSWLSEHRSWKSGCAGS